MSFDDVDIASLRRRKGEKWTRYPVDVLPAWVADMDFPIAEPIQEYLRQALLDTDLGYPINPTSKDLPTVFASRARQRWGWKLDPSHVEVMTDVVQGMYIALWVLCDAGEGVVVQTPVYPPFLLSVQEVGRRQVTNELPNTDAGYEIDFDGLRAAIDARTRVLMLCNPQNPTGRVMTRAELETLAEIVLEHDLYVISDEIHGDLVYPGHEHVPLATVGPEIEARTITFTSATKAFNIAGLRCSIAAFGSEALKTRFNSLPHHMRGGLNAPGLNAAEIAWTRCDDWLASLIAYLDDNRKLMDRFVRERLPGVHMHLPQATYLAWLDCRERDLPDGPYHFFLKEARVALSNGPNFGQGGEGFVRLNFATSRAILTEILERLEKSLS